MFLSPARRRTARVRLLSVALAVVTAASYLAGSPTATAQAPTPAPAESAEDATVFLQSYRLPDEVLPEGYAHTYDVAWTNATQALDYVVNEPTDPRPAEAILQEFEAAGRVVQLLSLYNAEAEGAPDLWYQITLFRTPEGAAQALKNPGLAETIKAGRPVSQVQLAGLGQGMVAFKVESTSAEGEPRHNDIILWQQGRVVFTMSAFGEPEAADALFAELPASAAKAAAHLAAQPAAPASFGPRASYLPSEPKTLELLQALQQRLLPDDAFEGLELDGVDSTNLPELMHETPVAEEPISDIGFFKERAVGAERYIIGLSKAFSTPEADSTPPETGYPGLNHGYYVYADAAGAAEALNAPAAEYGLKLYQENEDLPGAPALEELALPIKVGEQSRAFKAAWTLDDHPMETTVLRWRRGAVELWVGVNVAAGEDPTALLTSAVQKHDAAYTATPLPGY